MSGHRKRIREEHTFDVGAKGNTLHVGLVLEDGRRPILQVPDAVRATTGGRTDGLFLDRGYAAALADALALAEVEIARWDAEHASEVSQ